MRERNLPLEALQSESSNEARNIPYCFMDRSEIIESAIYDGATEPELLEVTSRSEYDRAANSVSKHRAFLETAAPEETRELLQGDIFSVDRGYLEAMAPKMRHNQLADGD